MWNKQLKNISEGVQMLDLAGFKLSIINMYKELKETI